MKKIKCTRILAVFLASLIVMLPVCFADTLNLIYDKNGNLLGGDGFYRVYNSLNQLWKVYNGTNTSGTLLQEFTYHPTEERVLIKKTYNSSGNETVYYISKDLVRIVNDSGTFDFTYVYHEGQLVAERNHEGTKTYYHPDHLGSTSLTTDSGGSIVEETFYTPFGVILSGGEDSRYDYTGQEYDNTIEDYDYHARRYKAEWGKLIQPDRIFYDFTKFDKERQISYYNPQLLNKYSYANNNPYKYIDKDGNIPVLVWPIVTGLIGAIVGGAVSYHYQKSVHGTVDPSRFWSSVAIGGLVGLGLGLNVAATAPALISAGAVSISGEVATSAASSYFIEVLTDLNDYSISVKEKEEETSNLNIKKGIYVDELGNEIPIMVPENAGTINVYGGSSSLGTQAVIVGHKGDGTPVWGAPGTTYNGGSNSNNNNQGNSANSNNK